MRDSRTIKIVTEYGPEKLGTTKIAWLLQHLDLFVQLPQARPGK